jgi:hypothetical protein
MTTSKQTAVLTRPIEETILLVRGKRVILDADLAAAYLVPTKALNQAARRNPCRFPEDFMFQLTREEHEVLRSQIVTSKKGRGGRRYLPYAFTEHGAVMAANLLNSDRAIGISVYVVRAFVHLRETLAGHKELAAKIAQLERTLVTHDKQILTLFQAIKRLMAPPDPPARKRKTIGFVTEEDREVRSGSNKRGPIKQWKFC